MEEFSQLFIYLTTFIKSLVCDDYAGKPRLMAYYPCAKILAFSNFTIR